ncbi:MAG TPA: hypothetical protein VK196_11675 [Magnetospirillum sp.]|nr:hypothetical protein [Magnetospirillum sp.]
MVLALPPDTLLEWLGFELPAMLLGKKEKATEPLRKALNNLKAGRQKRVHQKTEAALLGRMLAKVPVPGLLDEIRQLPDGPPWERAMRSLNMGLQRGGTPPLTTLEAETIRLERLAIPVKDAVGRGDFQAAVDQIARADMPPAPCLQGIMGQIDCRGSKDRFAQTAAPEVIVTTLYLLACAEADWCDEGDPLGERLLPEIRGNKLVRPMRRWLEAIMETNGLRSQRSLVRFLLGDRAEDTSRPELRRWWRSGTIPAWTKVPEMARSISRETGRKDADTLEKMIRTGLGAVRLLDGLLVLSIAVQNHHLPYDPWAPFRDYPAMLAHARKVKAGLSA